jgi:hypothetical protein
MRAEKVFLGSLANSTQWADNKVRLNVMKKQFPELGLLSGSRGVDNIRSWSWLVQGVPEVGIPNETR